MSEIDPAAVEADVRRYLGAAYDSADDRAVYDAATAAEQAHAAHAQAVARRIADLRAGAVSRLYEQERRATGKDQPDKKAFGARLGLTRQRAGQLLERAQASAARRGAPVEAETPSD